MNSPRLIVAARARLLVPLVLVAPAVAQGIRFDADPFFDVDDGPRKVIEADLDADGDLDVAVPCYGLGTLCILLNRGPADFAPKVSYTASPGAWGARAGDLDADGDVDIAVVSSSPGRVTVFLNTGNGTFLPGTVLTTGASPSEVEFGDVDGDLDVDLVVANNGSSSVSVLANLGGGVFAAHVTYPAGSSPSSIVLVDLDLDGDLDLATTNITPRTITILQNSGAGAFAISATRTTGIDPIGIVSGDFAGDGWPDLACVNNGSSSVRYFEGTAGGILSAGITLPASVSFPEALSVEDYAGDGDADLVVSNGYQYSVLQNQGAGTFLPALVVPSSATIGFGGHDYDSDGDRELLSIVAGSVAMRMASPDGTFPSTPGFTAGVSVQELLTHDLDGDGDVDIAALNGWPAHTLSILLNPGTGAFGSPVSTASVDSPLSLAPGDVDGDGDLDLVVGGMSAPRLGFHANQGSGAFGPLVVIPSAGGQIWGLAVGDIDADGDTDVVHGNWYGAPPYSVEVHVNLGGGTFAPGVIYAAGNADPTDFTLGDIDGDADLDVVYSSTYYSRVSALRNSGAGVFAPREDLVVTGFGASDMKLGDMDLDGDLDVVATSDSPSSECRVAVSFQTSPGVFAAPLLLGAGEGTKDLSIEDFDGDGDRDIATESFNGQCFTWYENLGGGVFGERRDAAGGQSNQGVGDFDGDGDVDLIHNGYSSGFTTMSRNVGINGRPFCAGDGSSTACPCGNSSAPGSAAGCLNSLGTPGSLRGSGRARLADDRFELRASGMPNASALYFQGTTQIASLFGDGLRCAGGSVVRLATKTNSAGASVYPGPADPRVSVRGAVAVPGTRTYQVWYRNAAAFCTPSTFNLTNGWLLEWGP